MKRPRVRFQSSEPQGNEGRDKRGPRPPEDLACLPTQTPTTCAQRYLKALQDRHFRDLKFAEVTRGLRALSAGYVEKRGERGLARALDGRGKRAAFGLYYGSSHFLAVQALVIRLGLAFRGPGRASLLDLGCGTGACGAAWALESLVPVSITAADRSSFALHEARWTYQVLGLKGETSRSIREALERSKPPDGIVLGWTLNELDDENRDLLAARLVPWVDRGARLLVVEPVSARVTPWWEDWVRRFPSSRCSSLEIRLGLELPPRVALLGRSAGLRTGGTPLRVLAANPGLTPLAPGA